MQHMCPIRYLVCCCFSVNVVVDEYCVIVAHCCIALLATPNDDITFDTTRRVRVFMRLIRKETVQRMGRTVHLLMVMPIYVSPSMTFASWRVTRDQQPSLKLHFVLVWNLIVS